ncbi:MAG: TolC family protein [Chlamydiota bacterium]|nr:TolC family protein [Chlamydiota bacterium]
MIVILSLFICCSCNTNKMSRSDSTIKTVSDKSKSFGSEWWNEFNDPILTNLIEETIESNHDIKIAWTRVCEARAARKAAKSAFLPDITGSGTYQRYQFSDNGIIPIKPLEETGLIDTNHNLYDIGFDASWEIDIFGANRAKGRAATERVYQTIEMYRDVMITLLAELAKNYLQLRGQQHIHKTLEERLLIQHQIIDDFEVKGRSGLLSEVEISRAITAENEIQGAIVASEGLIRAAIYRIGVLIGKHPNSLGEQLGKVGDIPNAPIFDMELVSADIIAKRPDIRALQRSALAQHAEVESAKAAMFPSLYMLALYRFQSLSLADLFKSGSQWWFLGPFVNWKVFERYKLQANVEMNNAQYTRTAEELKRGILLALEDIESSHTFYRTSKERVDYLKKAVASSSQTVELTEKLLNTGLKSYLDHLRAKQEYTVQKENMIRAQVDHHIQTVRLYKALGGC